MKQACLFYFTFLLCIVFVYSVDDFKVQTGASIIFFGVDHPKITYFAYDAEEDRQSENAFIIEYNSIAERDYLTDEIVQIIPVPFLNFTFTFVEEPEITGLNYTDAVQIIYFNELTQSKMISWVFTKDQTIVDPATGTETFVAEGTSKFSFESPFFPFTNTFNYLEFSVNATNLIPDEMLGCVIPETDATESMIACNTKEIIGTLQLLNEEVVTDFVTFTPKIQPVDIEYYLCLTDYGKRYTKIDSLNGQVGNICNVSLSALGEFPPGYSSEILLDSSEYESTFQSSDAEECDDDSDIEKPRIPTVSQIEIKIRLSNFANSSVQYDPELSVLFSGTGSSGGGRNGKCSTSGYDVTKDWILWTSIGCAVLVIVICLLFLAFASTKVGIRVLHGKEQSRITSIRAINKSNPDKLQKYLGSNSSNSLNQSGDNWGTSLSSSGDSGDKQWPRAVV